MDVAGVYDAVYKAREDGISMRRLCLASGVDQTTLETKLLERMLPLCDLSKLNKAVIEWRKDVSRDTDK